MICNCNKAVKEATAVKEASTAAKRGTYNEISPEKQAIVAKYAAEHGNNAAVLFFSKKFGAEIKPSSVSTWKGKYLKEIKLKTKAGEAPEVLSFR